MKKKILSILLIGVMIIGFTGCGAETEEERLQRELKENRQRLQESINNYNDLQETINNYNRYKDAIDNAK